MEDKLQERWNRIANELVLDKKLYYQFLYWYSHPYRAYHNLKHIEDCLNEFDDAKHLIENKGEAEIALWFHDVVYDTHSKANEKESAKLAYQVLKEEGLESFGKRVYNLVLATKHNAIPDKLDAKFIVDIDLSILGKSEKEFEEYEKNIRREYDWVSEEQFRAGRFSILNGFMKREHIYLTDFFRQKYEAQARANLESSLLRLK